MLPTCLPFQHSRGKNQPVGGFRPPSPACLGLSIYAVKLSIKLSMSFSQRQKILKCLWSKNFELQKCGHTQKSNYGLTLPTILMFLTIYYGVGKSQCDRSQLQGSDGKEEILQEWITDQRLCSQAININGINERTTNLCSN